MQPRPPHQRLSRALRTYLRGFSDVVDLHLAVEVSFIPCHDLRRHKTDIADAQGMGLTIAILNLGILNQIGRNIGLPVLRSTMLALT